ncbi:hypothetical protein ACFYZE_21065 [Streptomyces sp. NPDC001796]|uniref:hypothetical protein n=1 Tax=Streptomyces sp. NPDC001796 TaxID=3364609 RepID=UPI0036AAFBA4
MATRHDKLAVRYEAAVPAAVLNARLLLPDRAAIVSQYPPTQGAIMKERTGSPPLFSTWLQR